MQEEHGLRPDSLDSLVAGRIQTSRGWRLAPRSLPALDLSVDHSAIQTAAPTVPRPSEGGGFAQLDPFSGGGAILFVACGEMHANIT